MILYYIILYYIISYHIICITSCNIILYCIITYIYIYIYMYTHMYTFIYVYICILLVYVWYMFLYVLYNLGMVCGMCHWGIDVCRAKHRTTCFFANAVLMFVCTQSSQCIALFKVNQGRIRATQYYELHNVNRVITTHMVYRYMCICIYIYIYIYIREKVGGTNPLASNSREEKTGKKPSGARR